MPTEDYILGGIVIFAILFILSKIIKFINYIRSSNDTATTKIEDSQDNTNTIGEEYEKHIGNIYRSHGYWVYQKGIEQGKKDGGIDIVAKKGNKTILIQCKYWSSKTLYGETLRKFLGDCLIYVIKKQYNLNDVSFVMIVHPKCPLHYSAAILFEENQPKIRLKKIPMYKKRYDSALNTAKETR